MNNFMYTIGIIGYGFVGEAVSHGFKDNHTILAYDKYKNLDSFEDVAKKSDFIFVCLPTPFKGERIDLAIMDESMAELTKYTDNTNTIVVIKSTVVPGTTKRYAREYPNTKFAFNPEFLTEANYLNDFVNTDRIVIGAETDDVKKTIRELYETRFSNTPFFLTDATSAEMVKYMANTFLMTKVLFANEMYDLCNTLGIDYDPVKDMVAADKRIGSSHLNVTDDRGFGGKCFPKDIIAIMGLYKDLGIDHAILDTVWKKNLKIREKRDWEDIPFVKSEDEIVSQ